VVLVEVVMEVENLPQLQVLQEQLIQAAAVEVLHLRPHKEEQEEKV
jgi:hypothetical protein